VNWNAINKDSLLEKDSGVMLSWYLKRQIIWDRNNSKGTHVS
jgi:hypothetical protein